MNVLIIVILLRHFLRNNLTLGLTPTGRENTEEGWNGDVCYSACYHVLCYVGASNPEGDTVLIHAPRIENMYSFDSRSCSPPRHYMAQASKCVGNGMAVRL
eukprot:TRINITY_DN4373_c0_g2_i7.p1 TRINITY_DN4373_c0_g2~~TRINITY_DN4373_c0_g2_i7.p1  ORF type:complete len:101 (+),score=16.23 TRINITY_DN4373_c0_g2_i7:136-438(+)